MGLPPDQALSAIRLSLGRSTAPINIETAAKAFVAAIQETGPATPAQGDAR